MANPRQINFNSDNKYTVVHEGKVVEEISNYLNNCDSEVIAGYHSHTIAAILADFWNYLLDNALDFRDLTFAQLVDFFCALQIKSYINPPTQKYFVPVSIIFTPKMVSWAINIILDFYKFFPFIYPVLSHNNLDLVKEKLIEITTLAPQELPALFDLDQVLNTCSLYRDKLIILLAVKLGLRTNEMINLTLDDLEIARDRCVMVVDQKGRDRQVPLLTEPLSEEHTFFSTVIDNYFHQEYPATMAERNGRKLLVNLSYRYNHGLGINYGSVNNIYKKLRFSGHPKIKSGNLKYQFILNALNYGLHPEYISRMLGINSLISTRHQIDKALNSLD